MHTPSKLLSTRSNLPSSVVGSPKISPSKRHPLSYVVPFRSQRDESAVQSAKGCENNTNSPAGVILSIFPNKKVIPDDSQHAMKWYCRWVEEQVDLLPATTLSVIVGHSSNNSNNVTAELLQVFCAIAAFAQSSHQLSIDEIVDHLVSSGLIDASEIKDRQSEARSLVFAVLGWQTMLYKPAIGTCPPQQLAITDEQAGYRGQAFVSLKQHQMTSKRPLYEFLMGFGILLPPLNFCGGLDLEEKGAFDIQTTVKPSHFNASIFQNIGHFRLKWVDVLSCHLELDERSKTVYLFRHPSFCLASIPATTCEQKVRSVLHAAAAPADSSRQWATEDAVTTILQETLLSYRLLFGQNKRSRNLFRTLNNFAGIPKEARDPILDDICGRKICRLQMIPKDKDNYELHKDFPALRSRIVKLHQALSASKPSTWKELWRDRRDSADWLTFWAVIIFGAVAILLAFAQVVLQIIQIVMNR